MLANFAVDDRTFFILVGKFNWILERDDLFLVGLVDVIDDRGQCRGFTASCRTSDEDQTLFVARQLLQGVRQI